MKKYLVLFREPDGRTEPHAPEDIARHQANWQAWFARWSQAGNLAGGSSLTLEGRLIEGADAAQRITPVPHRVGTELVGGFLLLNAGTLDEATDIARSCPIFEFDGYAEVREMQS
jgi:hypothetical protein